MCYGEQGSRTSMGERILHVHACYAHARLANRLNPTPGHYHIGAGGALAGRHFDQIIFENGWNKFSQDYGLAWLMTTLINRLVNRRRRDALVRVRG